MASTLPFVDMPPEIEQRGSVVVVTITSGDAVQSFALTLHAARAMIEVGRRRLDEIDRNLCGLIPLHPTPPRRRNAAAKPAKGA